MHVTARAALVVGAIGSLAFMFNFGRHAPPLLIVIFFFWVSSPFVVLWWANSAAKRWNRQTRMAVQIATLFIASASLAIYAADTLGPPHPQGAFVYTAVPPASWVVAALLIGSAALTFRSRR